MCSIHRNYVGVIERAGRTPSIVTADKLARGLGTNLSSMFSELERGSSDLDGGCDGHRLAHRLCSSVLHVYSAPLGVVRSSSRR